MDRYANGTVTRFLRLMLYLYGQITIINIPISIAAAVASQTFILYVNPLVPLEDALSFTGFMSLFVVFFMLPVFFLSAFIYVHFHRKEMILFRNAGTGFLPCAACVFVLNLAVGALLTIVTGIIQS